VAQLRREKQRFDDAGAGIVLVGMGTPRASAEFAVRFGVPFPIVADPERKLYRLFDLRRMNPLGFLSPALALKGVSALAGGHGLGAPQGDVRQLPGVFIIDTLGRIVFGHYAADPSDHPDTATLLESLPHAGGGANKRP
jgi:peroxiredoxin